MLAYWKDYCCLKEEKKWNNHVFEKRETQADTQIYSNRSISFFLRAYYVPALIKPQTCTNSSDPPYNAVRWVLLLLFGLKFSEKPNSHTM